MPPNNPTGLTGTILNANSPDCIFGPGPNLSELNAGDLATFENTIYPTAAQSVVNSYALNAIINAIGANAINAIITPGSDPLYKIQVGTGSSDFFSLQFPNTSISALGIDNINALTYNNAQSALAKTQSASLFLSSALAFVNAQYDALEQRRQVVEFKMSELQESIDEIKNTDLTATSLAMSASLTASSSTLSLLQLNAKFNATIMSALKNILAKK